MHASAHAGQSRAEPLPQVRTNGAHVLNSLVPALANKAKYFSSSPALASLGGDSVSGADDAAPMASATAGSGKVPSRDPPSPGRSASALLAARSISAPTLGSVAAQQEPLRRIDTLWLLIQTLTAVADEHAELLNNVLHESRMLTDDRMRQRRLRRRSSTSQLRRRSLSDLSYNNSPTFKAHESSPSSNASPSGWGAGSHETGGLPEAQQIPNREDVDGGASTSSSTDEVSPLRRTSPRHAPSPRHAGTTTTPRLVASSSLGSPFIVPGTPESLGMISHSWGSQGHRSANASPRAVGASGSLPPLSLRSGGVTPRGKEEKFVLIADSEEAAITSTHRDRLLYVLWHVGQLAVAHGTDADDGGKGRALTLLVKEIVQELTNGDDSPAGVSAAAAELPPVQRESAAMLLGFDWVTSQVVPAVPDDLLRSVEAQAQAGKQAAAQLRDVTLAIAREQKASLEVLARTCVQERARRKQAFEQVCAAAVQREEHHCASQERFETERLEAEVQEWHKVRRALFVMPGPWHGRLPVPVPGHDVTSYWREALLGALETWKLDREENASRMRVLLKRSFVPRPRVTLVPHGGQIPDAPGRPRVDDLTGLGKDKLVRRLSQYISPTGLAVSPNRGGLHRAEASSPPPPGHSPSDPVNAHAQAHASTGNLDDAADSLVALNSFDNDVDDGGSDDAGAGPADWDVVNLHRVHYASRNEHVVHSTECELVLPMAVIAGRMDITLTHMYFYGDTVADPGQSYGDEYFTPAAASRVVSSSAHTDPTVAHVLRTRRYALMEIVRVLPRRYLLRRSALEFFMSNRKSYLFNFRGSGENLVVLERLAAQLRATHAVTQRDSSGLQVMPGLTVKGELLRGIGLVTAGVIGTGRKLEEWTNLWVNRKVTTFDYLSYLNTAAGRTFNDLTQYPVFPWVLSDYESASIDLSDAKHYRDLSKPIGALNPKRLQRYLDRAAALEPDQPVFLYGSHYSTVGSVLYYLVRLEPFTSFARHLQGGRLDVADRLFHDVAATWQNCLDSASDVKELIPAWFYNPEMFRNRNGVDFGERQDGSRVDNVNLPPWCESPEDFVRINREALEGEIVSQTLPAWIDLIFGFKQRGQAAKDADNLFFPLCYEGAVDLGTIKDPVARRATEAQVANFGQVPTQLFTRPHPARVRPQECAPGRGTPVTVLPPSSRSPQGSPGPGQPGPLAARAPDPAMAAHTSSAPPDPENLHSWRRSLGEEFTVAPETGRVPLNPRQTARDPHWSVAAHLDLGSGQVPLNILSVAPFPRLGGGNRTDAICVSVDGYLRLIRGGEEEASSVHTVVGAVSSPGRLLKAAAGVGSLWACPLHSRATGPPPLAVFRDSADLPGSCVILAGGPGPELGLHQVHFAVGSPSLSASVLEYTAVPVHSPITVMTLGADGLLVCGAADGSVLIWDLCAESHPLHGGANPVDTAANPSSSVAAVAATPQSSPLSSAKSSPLSSPTAVAAASASAAGSAVMSKLYKVLASGGAHARASLGRGGGGGNLATGDTGDAAAAWGSAAGARQDGVASSGSAADPNGKARRPGVLRDGARIAGGLKEWLINGHNAPVRSVKTDTNVGVVVSCSARAVLVHKLFNGEFVRNLLSDEVLASWSPARREVTLVAVAEGDVVVHSTEPCPKCSRTECAHARNAKLHVFTLNGTLLGAAHGVQLDAAALETRMHHCARGGARIFVRSRTGVEVFGIGGPFSRSIVRLALEPAIASILTSASAAVDAPPDEECTAVAVIPVPESSTDQVCVVVGYSSGRVGRCWM